MRKNGFTAAAFTIFIISFVIVNILPLSVSGKERPDAITKGKTLPNFKLPVPADPRMKHYLGVDGGKDFTLNQIHSKMVLIEIFSPLCPECLKNAPRVNVLYNIIRSDPDLSARIVMLGIAVGNEEKLVRVYQKKYNVKFPLFPDPDSAIDDSLPGINTPTLILTDNTGKVLFIHGGFIDDMDHILGVLRSNHGK